jgi:perosamine synthetase
MSNEVLLGRPNFSDAEIDAVARVMRGGWVGMGPETLRFEAELAEYVQAPFVVTTSSCTAALQLSLMSLGVAAGDEVIVPSFTWCSTANAALYAGASPVFCDIDPDTFCINPSSVAAALTPRTRAVVPVHFGGLAIDTRALRARLPPGVHIVEDAAHALGAWQPDGLPVGASGHLTCFSFYANKVLSTGEGGAIALADQALASRLQSLRLQGQPSNAWQRYSQPERALPAPSISSIGLKANYTDLHAAIGRVQLRRQAEFAATRERVAAIYCGALAGTAPGLQFQTSVLEPAHARHLFTLLLPRHLGPNRNAFLVDLRAQGIGAGLHYTPLHQMPGYAALRRMPLPHTEEVASRILTLPIGAAMSDNDAERVVCAFLKSFHRLSSAAS